MGALSTPPLLEGYGWRYFDDPGVSREFDPDGAFDGSYYLRLSAGASSHQT